jgi:hypothetical protein
MIEIIGVLLIVGIAAGISVYRVNYWRYRMDGNVRLVQNFIIAAQQVAIRNNVVVRVMVDANDHLLSRAEIEDPTQSPVRLQAFPLQEGARFVVPASTIDGVAADGLVTGPGRDLDLPCAALKPCFRLSSGGQVVPPSGSGAGDVVIYLGSPRGIANDLRAIQVIGATARAVGWSRASGAWRRMN